MPVRKFLAKHKNVIVPQPPYSPDLANTGFFLFPKLKTSMKGKRFATICNKVVRSIGNTTFEVMRRLRQAIRQKGTVLCKNKSWILNNDNASVHTSMLVREFLAKNKTVIMLQPPCSPDLAPADFFLFPITEDTNKRKAFCYNWGDEKKNRNRSRFRSVSRIGKN